MTTQEAPQYPLDNLIRTDMSEPIDPGTVSNALSKPPFINLPGAINIRDIGLLPNSPIRPGLIYRSGAISKVSSADLANLNIRMILDLRSLREVLRDPTTAVEGIENVHSEVSGVPNPVDMQNFVQDGGSKGYTDMYMEILELYQQSFREMLMWVREKKTPILFHCTAGKDRTGVLSALLLSLVGAPESLIAYDYALSRVGVEPSRELLFQMLKLWNKDWTMETPGMHEFTQVKGEFILSFLKTVRVKFGSVYGYVRVVLGFSIEDVDVIKGVLRDHGEGTVS